MQQCPCILLDELISQAELRTASYWTLRCEMYHDLSLDFQSVLSLGLCCASWSLPDRDCVKFFRGRGQAKECLMEC